MEAVYAFIFLYSLAVYLQDYFQAESGQVLNAESIHTRKYTLL